MKKKLDEFCNQAQLEALNTFRISAKTQKMKMKDHRFIVKMIKRARVLGLLPFTHLNLNS